MCLLLTHTKRLDASVYASLACVSKRLAVTQPRRALVLSRAQSRALYARRDEPHARHLLTQCVHTLNLRRTPVTDVSALGGVHELYLSRTRVTDVSALGGVHTLDLSRTPVTDVSALGGVHVLTLPDGSIRRLSSS